MLKLNVVTDHFGKYYILQLVQF